MSRYRIVQFRDAIVRYEVEIDANSADEALGMAVSRDCDWAQQGVSQFDHAEMEVQDQNGLVLVEAHKVW